MSSLMRIFAPSDRRDRVPLADSVNCHYSVALLVVLGLVTAFPQLVMEEPITCNHSNDTTQMASYVNKVCWSRGSVLPNVNGSVSGEVDADSPANRRIFTRLPLVFLVQGLLLYLPHLFWQVALQNPVVPFCTLLNSAVDWYETEDVELARARLEFLHSRMYRFLCSLTAMDRPTRRVFTFFGNYLTACYVAMKILYVVAVSACLSFTALVMGDFEFELSSLVRMSQGSYTSDYLPPAVVCHYDISDVAGVVLRQIFNCTLPQNELNQMVFLALGCWFSVLLCINAASLVCCIVGTVVLRWRSYDIEMYLKCTRHEEVPKRQLEYFLHKFLRRDGVFILQYVAFVASDQLVGLMVEHLWETFGDELKDTRNGEEEEEIALTKLA